MPFPDISSPGMASKCFQEELPHQQWRVDRTAGSYCGNGRLQSYRERQGRAGCGKLLRCLVAHWKSGLASKVTAVVGSTIFGAFHCWNFLFLGVSCLGSYDVDVGTDNFVSSIVLVLAVSIILDATRMAKSSGPVYSQVHASSSFLASWIGGTSSKEASHPQEEVNGCRTSSRFYRKQGPQMFDIFSSNQEKSRKSFVTCRIDMSILLSISVLVSGILDRHSVLFAEPC